MAAAGGPAGGALRHRSDTGVDDAVQFIGGDERVFAVVSSPAERDRTTGIGVVLCPSVAHELVKNYRREVLIARALAAVGVPCARLQYRGSGNSDGDAADMGYESMRDDALLVAEHLVATTKVSQVVFLGSRFGCLVAASAATARGGAPVVCLEPVLSPERYVKDGFRAKLMQGIGRGEAGSSTDFSAELARTGSIDVFGVPLYKRFVDSWAGKTLSNELSVAAPVLLMHLGRQRPKAEMAALQAELDDRGFATTVGQAASDESWWYLDEKELLQIGSVGDGEQEGMLEPSATEPVLAQVQAWVESLAAG